MSNIIKLFFAISLYFTCALTPAYMSIQAQELTINSQSEMITKEDIYNVEFEGCSNFLCWYKPSSVPNDVLANIVRKSISQNRVSGHFFTEDHHISGETEIEVENNRIEFSSESQECEFVNRFKGEKQSLTNLNCENLINYLLVKNDEYDIYKAKDVYKLTFIIFQYDTESEKGYDVGVSANIGKRQSTIAESTLVGAEEIPLENVAETISRTELSYDSNEPLSSLFSTRLGNLKSDVLSVNLSIGNLRNYIKTYKSFTPVVIEARNRFNFSLEKEKHIAKAEFVGTSNEVFAEAGVFLGGTVVPHFGIDDQVTIENLSLNYIRPATSGSLSETTFKIATEINLNRHGSLNNLFIKLDRPKMIFNVNTSVLQQEKGFGFLFAKNRTIEKNLNLIGVLHLTKVSEIDQSPQQDPDEAVMLTSAASFDFKQVFTAKNISFKYDPVMVMLNLASADASEKNSSSGSISYKIKPYLLKLKSIDENLPESILNQQVVIETSVDSPVNIMDSGNFIVTSLDTLLNHGVYIGLDPKAEAGDFSISPLNIKLQITLDPDSVLRADFWTKKGMSNQAIFEFIHNLQGLSDTNSATKIGKSPDVIYNYVPWRK